MSDPVRLPKVFDAFFDDAAIFPPGRAPLGRAIHTHITRRTTSIGAAAGPLLLTPDKLDDAARLISAIGPDTPVRVGLVVAPGELAATLAAADRVPPSVQVTGLELKTGDTEFSPIVDDGDALTDRFDVHVELTVPQVRAGALARLAGTAVRLKVRTGGLTAEAFPTVDELADVISTAVVAHRSFKLTAGLHRAVRYTDQTTGFPHHGFLNIAVATSDALCGAGRRHLAQILAETDGAALAERFRDSDDQWRTMFESFGTCSIAEPLATLTDLGLVPSAAIDDSSGDFHDRHPL